MLPDCNVIPYIRRHELSNLIEGEQFTSKNVAYIVGKIDAFRSILAFCDSDQRAQIVATLHQRLKCNLEEEHYLYQLSESKFACVIFTNESNFEQYIHSILMCFATPIQLINHPPIWIGVSGGISTYPEDAQDVTALMSYAENALSDAQQKGGNRIERFNNENRIIEERYLVVYQRLCHAIKNDDFELYFQPMFDPLANKTIICEALARWNDEFLGQVGPDEFIDVAENSGLIKPLSKLLFSRLCRYIRKINQELVEPIKFSYNLSRKELELGIDNFISVAIEYPELVCDIILEVTETAASKDIIRTVDQIQELKSMGYQIALDDFGTGYSALGCLDMFPIDYIKIDRYFVDNLLMSATDEIIIEATIAIARCLDVKVVAEGVENKGQIAKLVNMGADYLQGYEICRPQTKDFIIEYLYVQQISVLPSQKMNAM